MRVHLSVSYSAFDLMHVLLQGVSSNSILGATAEGHLTRGHLTRVPVIILVPLVSDVPPENYGSLLTYFIRFRISSIA